MLATEAFAGTPGMSYSGRTQTYKYENISILSKTILCVLNSSIAYSRMRIFSVRHIKSSAGIEWKRCR
jgi:hypothetical protein